MNRTRKCVSLALLILLVLLTGCKPKEFLPQEIELSKSLVERALNAYAAGNVEDLQKCFVPTATGLPVLVNDLRRTWYDTLKAAAVITATIQGYHVVGFDVVENQPSKLTASVIYTGTYAFQYAQGVKTYVCNHQIQVTLVRYDKAILISDLSQQGIAPACQGVK